MKTVGRGTADFRRVPSEPKMGSHREKPRGMIPVDLHTPVNAFSGPSLASDEIETEGQI